MCAYRRSPPWLPVVLLLPLLLGVGNCLAGERPELSAREAREELELVLKTIENRHPQPFHAVSRERFYEEVARLRRREAPVAVASQYFDLMALASLISDTHTQLHITAETPGFDASFPLRFRIFPEGVFIIAGSDGYRQAIGKKVVTIGGRPVAAVIEQLARHAPADNQPRKRVFAEVFLYLPESYAYLGLLNPDGSVALQLEDDSGAQFGLTLGSTWQKGYADFSWDTQNPFVPGGLLTAHELAGGQPPLYLQDLDDNYRYRFLDGERKYLYLQINRQFEKDQGQASIEFHLEWARQLLDAPVEVMIIDLRNDPGGTVNVGNPVSALLSGIYFNHPTMRGVAVLFGPDTVSAGTIIIAQLEDTLRPVMIGQPSGSAPNMFLNAHKIVLPHSRLEFEVSTDIYVSTRDADTRAYIAPDIPMAMSFAEYLRGEDPLIEYAKTIDKALRSGLYQSASPYDPWQRTSQQPAFRRRPQ